MMKVFFTVSVLAVLLWNCSAEPLKKKKDYPVERIVFASGGCLADCPYSALEADSNGMFRYYGDAHTSHSGFYKGKISDSLWIDLISRCEKMGFRKLDTSYPRSVNEMPVEMVLYYDHGSRKRIIGSYHSFPDSVQYFLKWMMELPDQIGLSRADSMRFETRVHIPPQPKIIQDGHFVPPFGFIEDKPKENKKDSPAKKKH